MPLAEQIPQYTIMSLAALAYRHATLWGRFLQYPDPGWGHISIAKKKEATLLDSLLFYMFINLINYHQEQAYLYLQVLPPGIQHDDS